MQQLTLSLALRQEMTFENYRAGANAQCIQHLRDTLLVGVGERFFYLWGTVGLGSTHLLQACCHDAGGLLKTAVYLDFREHKVLSPLVLDGLETIDVLCLDHIDAIAGKQQWEEKLFHLYNRVRETRTIFIAAGSKPPTQLPLTLPDLQSRLAWGLVYQLQELADEEKCAVLQLHAEQRGLELSTEVANFILTREGRGIQELLQILQVLDEASLQHQRRLTIPFVKSVLKL